LKDLKEAQRVVDLIMKMTDEEEVIISRNTENTEPFDVHVRQPIESKTVKALIFISTELRLKLSFDRDAAYLI
jgi:hypothetical protein